MAVATAYPSHAAALADPAADRTYVQFYYQAVLIPLYTVFVRLGEVTCAAHWARYAVTATHELTGLVEKNVLPLGNYSSALLAQPLAFLTWPSLQERAEHSKRQSRQEVQQTLLPEEGRHVWPSGQQRTSALLTRDALALAEAVQPNAGDLERREAFEARCMLHELPDELLSEVFCQVPFDCRARLPLVCRRWAHILASPGPWRCVRVDTSRWSDAKERMAASWLAPRLACSTSISIGSSHYPVRIASPVLVRALTSALPRVTSLDVRNVLATWGWLDVAAALQLPRLAALRIEAVGVDDLDLGSIALPSIAATGLTSLALHAHGPVRAAAQQQHPAELVAAVPGAGPQQGLALDVVEGQAMGPSSSGSGPGPGAFPAFVLALRELRHLSLCLPAPRCVLPDALSSLGHLSSLELAHVGQLALPGSLSAMPSLQQVRLACVEELVGAAALPRGLHALELQGVRWNAELQARFVVGQQQTFPTMLPVPAAGAPDGSAAQLTGAAAAAAEGSSGAAFPILQELTIVSSGRAQLLPPWLPLAVPAVQALHLEESEVRVFEPQQHVQQQGDAFNQQVQQQDLLAQPVQQDEQGSQQQEEGVVQASMPVVQQPPEVEVSLDELARMSQLTWVVLAVAGERCRVRGCRLRLVAALPRLRHFELRCSCVRGADVLEQLSREFGQRGGCMPTLQLRPDSCGDLRALLEVSQPHP